MAAWLAVVETVSTSSFAQEASRAQEPAQAQDSNDEKPPEPRQPESPVFPEVLKEGTLDLSARLYLPDGRNKPIFYPNMRIADVLDMKRDQALRAEGGDLPNYIFDELKIEARVGTTAADIKARAKVTLSETALPSTAIALRLQSCLLSEPIAFEGNGESKCQVGRNDQPGYTWWLRAEPNTTHTATLVGQSVLLSEGDRQSIQLTLPVTLATIELYLPENYQDVRVRGQGGELLRVDSSSGEHKVVVRCQGGDINISWRNGSDGQPIASAAEATSETQLRVEEPREAWIAETDINLHAHGEAAIDSLTVDLPEGAEWLPFPLSPTEQYSISVVAPPSSSVPSSSVPSTSVPSTSVPSTSVPSTSAPSASTSGASTAGTASPASSGSDAAASGTPNSGAGANSNEPSTDNSLKPRSQVRLLIRAVSRTGLATLKAIPIRWRWTPPQTTTEGVLTDIAVPGITVRDVDRHEGTTTLIIPRAYTLYWKSQQGTQLIAQTRMGDIQEQQYVFRFARQPQGLLISFGRELNVAQVRPTYLAEVDRDKVKLTGWLECNFDRSQRPELGLELGDWTLDSARVISDLSLPYAEGESLSQQALPGGVVKLSHDLDAEFAGNGSRLQQLWRVVAYRNLNEGSIEHLKLTVPDIVLLAPDSSRVPVEHATGVLLMAASNNVLISWDERNSQSLLADTLSSEWSERLTSQLAERTMAYRFQAGADKSPVWAGRVEVLPRQIALEQSAVVKIDIDAARVIQKFNLQIANEPLTTLQLVAGSARELSVLVNGIPCVLQAESTTADPNQINASDGVTDSTTVAPGTKADGASTAQLTARPPAVDAAAQQTDDTNKLTIIGAPKLFGKVEVEVRSHHPLPSPAADSSDIITTVPLVRLDLPKAVLRTPTQVSVSVDRRLSASLGNGPAAPVAGGEESKGIEWSPLPNTPLELPASERELSLRIRHLDEMDPLPVRASGAWLQTVINGTTRADRFCARFRTQQQSIAISLPSYDLLAHVAIDGVQQRADFDSIQGRLQISLRDVPTAEEHTLEVWTRSASSLRWLNKIEVVPVKIEGCRRFDHFYWQLVTPSNQHLIWIPDSVTAEWRWVWDRLCWQRFSPLDQSYFEQWLAASSQLPLPESAHRYVMSSYGAVPGFRVWISSRLLLWLPMGLAAIGCALAVSLWRAARHPVALIVLAGGVAALAATWPDLAILLGQTALMALAIVLLYSLTQAAIESRVRRRSIFTTRPTSAMLETSDQNSLVRPGSHASSEIIATTRTQSPIVADSGGP